MAYQPYPYAGYQPTPYYPQPVPDQLAQLRQNQMQQMQPQMMQQPIQSMQPSTQPTAPQSGGINWVNSKQEADNWPIAPGCAVALWDSNNPVIYLRQADSTGKPSTKVYDLVERTDNPNPPQPAPNIDLSRYVTIDQLEDILSERLKRPSKATKQKEDTDNG
ncbi:hypothetical protein D1159_03975 [Pseudoflavonifractor sp. 524-17]|uniref:hypothetical protein n=1 Tax=Pseudoflavonifractor sp. 524-17 TaxID=2304577 RepID=UPI00137B2232|nr:hypothetical protein [Pseudoflavonifractor sp. 524-17]NCE63756.1 hypothetical protein [Pseudoflavonifractor sp. 524-17]